MQIDTAVITGKLTEYFKWTVKTVTAKWSTLPAKTKFVVCLAIVSAILALLAIRRFRTSPTTLRSIRWPIGTSTPTSKSALGSQNRSSSTISSAGMFDGSIRPPASTSTPDVEGVITIDSPVADGVVTGEDNNAYLLPSMFGTKQRNPDEMSMEIDGLEARVSFIETQLSKRVLQ